MGGIFHDNSPDLQHETLTRFEKNTPRCDATNRRILAYWQPLLFKIKNIFLKNKFRGVITVSCYDFLSSKVIASRGCLYATPTRSQNMRRVINSAAYP